MVEKSEYFLKSKRTINILSIVIPAIISIALIIKYSSFNSLAGVGLILIPFLWFSLRIVHSVVFDTALKSKIKYFRATEFETKVLLNLLISPIVVLVMYKAFIFIVNPWSMSPLALFPQMASLFFIAIGIVILYPVLLIAIRLLNAIFA